MNSFLRFSALFALLVIGQQTVKAQSPVLASAAEAVAPTAETPAAPTVSATEVAQLRDQLQQLTAAYSRLVAVSNQQADHLHQLEKTVASQSAAVPTRRRPMLVTFSKD
ncbi:hypothetical protein LJY25_02400 [Hymenobacter sp. BT175]|uniref:hypothetical protein n=1 Tax=Hymenobacter translucens TaxID=2886507 RepID=UPI001D0F1D42|nr:hypothetical protein [Hymenobacter translucens]MCC2545281.1 hypothetical protein [Hymenobacter translucens]